MIGPTANSFTGVQTRIRPATVPYTPPPFSFFLSTMTTFHTAFSMSEQRDTAEGDPPSSERVGAPTTGAHVGVSSTTQRRGSCPGAVVPALVSPVESSETRFLPPPPGIAAIVRVWEKKANTYQSIPALYYSAREGQHPHIYLFTRDRLGRAWKAEPHALRTAVTRVTDPNPLNYLSRRIDLPVEVVEALTLDLDVACGPEASSATIAEWRQSWLASDPAKRCEVPCARCGELSTVSLPFLFRLTGLAQGLECSSLGKILRDGPCAPPTPPVPAHPSVTLLGGRSP